MANTENNNFDASFDKFFDSLIGENDVKISLTDTSKNEFKTEISEIFEGRKPKGVVGIVINPQGAVVAEASHFGLSMQGDYSLKTAQTRRCTEKLWREFLIKHVNFALSEKADLDFCREFWNNAEKNGYSMQIMNIGQHNDN